MNENKEVKTITPFRKFCITIGELPSSYVESMSYYEMLLWFSHYLSEKVIPAVNNNAEVVAELQSFVENYFDNLDVQEEINNKLDEMVEDGTFLAIIEQFLEANALWSFDTVSDLKNASNLVNGSYARTLGFHTINDDGGAIYKIRTIEVSDTINEMDLLSLDDDTLLAELVKFELNVKQLGAYGDSTHDDHDILQYALNNAQYYTVTLPKGDYLIGSTLNYNGANLLIDGENANIIYSGEDYAISSNYLRFCTLKIGNITAANGGCIKMYVTSNANQFVYDNFYFRTLSASTSCVYAHCEGGGWINEIRWFNGKLVAGQYGFNIEHNHTGQWANNAINGWHFNNIGIEGVTTGFYLNAISGNICNFDFTGIRSSENFTTLLQTTGQVRRLNFYGSSTIFDTWLNLSNETVDSNIYTAVSINDKIQPSGFIQNGILLGCYNREFILNGGIPLSNNTNLNNVLQPGTYGCNSHQSSQTITNKPADVTGDPFKLIVIETRTNILPASPTSGFIIQIMFTTNGTTNIYYRKCTISSSTPTFGDWKSISST